MKPDDIVVVAARRTPIGAFQGALSSATAPQLSAAATTACYEDAGLNPEMIDTALIGCVLPAGIGQAPARQAVLACVRPELRSVSAAAVPGSDDPGIRQILDEFQDDC